MTGPDATREQTERRLLIAARLRQIYYPRRYENAWSPADLQVLRQVQEVAGRYVSGRELAFGLALDPGTVSASLKLLRERHLIVLDDQGDRGDGLRASRHLTQAGEELLERHLSHAHDRLVRWQAHDRDWALGVRYR